MTNIHVRTTRAFDGPRHDRLEDIWDAIAIWAAPRGVSCFQHFNVDPGRIGHADMFDEMWEEDKAYDNRYLLLTEQDFLPSLAYWDEGLLACCVTEPTAWGVQYRMRDEATLRLQGPTDIPGGWYVVFDKGLFNLQSWVQEPDFHLGRDPCNDLKNQLPDMALMPGTDGYPEHYGIDYPFGTHLFWSRHFHDSPDRVISGVRLGDMQERVDRFVGKWVLEQPDDYQEILAKL